MCTGIRLIAKNGDVVFARTMEFDSPLAATVGYMPRGQSFRGTTPTGADGLAWTNRYAYGGNVGTGEFSGQTIIGAADAMNEHGLVCGSYNLPGYTEFAPITDENRSRIIASWEATSYVVGMYKTTAEVREGIANGEFIVGATPFPLPGKPGQFPLHIRVGDASGDAIIVEWHAGDQPPTVYDAETGVCTNLPSYDFHLTNMRQFEHMSPYNPAGPFKEGSQDYKQTMGDGYLGVPGGSSSPDRFVRAWLYQRDAYTGATGEDTVWVAWNILNNFDMPPGLLRNIDADTNAESSEYTLWTGVADTKNLVYYFRSHTDNGIYEVDLKKQDPTGPKMLEDPRPNAVTRRTIPAFTG